MINSGQFKNNFLHLLWTLLKILLRHPWLLMVTIIPSILLAALGPIQGWLARNVLDHVSKGDAVFTVNDLLPYAWIAVGIFIGLGVLRLVEKITNRMLNDRMLIELQRIWFDHCGDKCPGERVARSLNDCENARKILELFQKELWVACVGLPAVLIWQISAAPEWLTALLFASAPPFVITLMFGGMIQRASKRILKSVSAVGSAIAIGDHNNLYAHQEKFYLQRIHLELWKQCSETTSELSRWLGIAVVLLLSAIGFLEVLPSHVTAGGIGLFLVNLGLLTKSLTEITKIYNKIREGWPAARRILQPDDSRDISVEIKLLDNENKNT